MKKRHTENKRNRLSQWSITKALLISSLIINPSEVGAQSERSNLNANEVPVVYQQTREIYENINEGDFVEAIREFLGLLGLLNPVLTAAVVGTRGTQEPYESPETPSLVYETQRYRDNVRAIEPQKISQGVFGPGQILRTFQAQQLDDAQDAAVTGYQGTFDAYRTSATKAFNSSVSASNVETLANAAVDATASQDVLKAIAAQNKDLSNIGANSSQQLSELTKTNYFQASQLLSANSQLSALNDKTQSMEVLSASENYLSAQIKSSVNQGNYYSHRKDAAGQDAARQSSTVVFIPGLNF
ncbi:MAG: hypothetical protein AB4062_04270 [Crocosphaera sp.]